MKIINNAYVDRSGAYYKSGGLIPDTQRFSTNHLMEYWQQGNLETTLAKSVNSINSVIEIKKALYVGRIPTHFGHFIMEGLPRLCDSINMKGTPIIGYITNGFLPEGILPTPIDDIRWVVDCVSYGQFYELGENETYQIETLYVSDLPLQLSQSCSEPWRMSSMIKEIVFRARGKHENINKPIEKLYLKRYEELVDGDYTISNPNSELSEQIATVSYAKNLYGKCGSNTHISIFADQNSLTEWTWRGDFNQTDRNQLICDLVKTFNVHKEIELMNLNRPKFYI